MQSNDQKHKCWQCCTCSKWCPCWDQRTNISQCQITAKMHTWNLLSNNPQPIASDVQAIPPKKTPMNPRCQPRTYVGHPAGLACFTNFTYQLRPSHILNSNGPQQSTMCKTVATYPSQSLLILGLGGGLTYTKSTYALYFACNSELNMPFSQCALWFYQVSPQPAHITIIDQIDPEIHKYIYMYI